MLNPSAGDDSPAVTLRLRRSPGLALAILLGWVPLQTLAWVAGGGGAHSAGLVLCLLILALSSVARAGITPWHTLPGLRIKDNRLTSLGPDETTLEWLPCKNSRLFSRIAWLELKAAGANCTRRRLLVTDLPGLSNLPREDFRQLRVWLRMTARYH